MRISPTAPQQPFLTGNFVAFLVGVYPHSVSQSPQ
nr:MAG TPA: hypothetical protein [Caudoviricetes sp.]